MRVRLVSADDEAGWRSALDNVPHGIAHTFDFVTLMGRAKNARPFLLVAENDRGKVICPLAERRFQDVPDVFTPYGISGFAGHGDLSGFPQAWENFAKEHDYVAAYVLQNPLLAPADIAGWISAESGEARETYWIDLTGTEDERLSRVSRRKRGALRKWLGAAAPETDRQKLADAFVGLYPGFMAQRGAGSAYRYTPEELTLLVSLPGTFLTGVCNARGEVCCVALFGMTAHSGDYLFMVSNEDGQEHGSGVLWLGLRHMASLQVPHCHLGGGIAEGDGVAEFKRRLGGQPLALHAVQQVFNAGRYRSLCREAGCRPGSTAYFPAYYGS